MQKDLKIGIVLGSVLAAAAAVWLSTHPSLSTKARMLDSRKAASPHPQNTGTQQKSSEQPIPPVIARRPQGRRGNLNTLSTNPESNHESRTTSIEHRVSRFHTVVGGETLSDISHKYYGAANKWQKILKANRETIKDANKLRPGTNLFIPE